MTFHKSRLLLITTGTFVCSMAMAQDFSLTPRFGTGSLSGGFTPDPNVISVLAGGSFDADDADSSCNGYITDEPTYRLNFSPGSLGLGIYVNAEYDTTLLINNPNGDWYCNDDHSDLNNLNSGYYFSDPASGQYDIWVGTYSESNTNRNAILAITEFSESSWETDLQAASPEISLSGGFLPDPYVFEVVAGGPNDADNLSNGCAGYVSDGPTYRLNYSPSTTSSLGLGIYTSADYDTTISIQSPGGSWFCNDDNSSLENLNGGYYFSSPESGEYDIYVGTYSEDNSGRLAFLAISEYSEDSWETNISAATSAPVEEPVPQIPDGEIQFGSKLL